MIDWLTANQGLLGWLTFASVATIVISLAALPWLVARIPADYFAYRKRHGTPLKQRHPLIRLLLLIGKNLLGATLLAGGLLMLFVPGQGLLTMAMGLLLLDYPGKFALERRIARQHSVLSGLNWLRARAGAAPLVIDHRDD
ncbi:MAG: PGPGW domain-containing protein [Pseudomonadota bacterium]